MSQIFSKSVALNTTTLLFIHYLVLLWHFNKAVATALALYANIVVLCTDTTTLLFTRYINLNSK